MLEHRVSATKTSLVEFLLESIVEKMIKTEKRKVAAVFFNVKGKDLLYLDKSDPQYEQTDSCPTAGQRCTTC